MKMAVGSARKIVLSFRLTAISATILSCGSSVPQSESPDQEEADIHSSSNEVSDRNDNQKSSSTLSKATIQKIIKSHNRLRAKHCAPPLKWSKRVASEAQSWADKLKQKGCSLVHSKDPALGENIWFGGPPGAIPLENAVVTWYAEEEDYNYRAGKFSADTGHFTQLVWQGTAKIGCGAATCPEGDILVCNYSPGGNVIGQFKANVLKTSACGKKPK